jgi:hypothetical protein
MASPPLIPDEGKPMHVRWPLAALFIATIVLSAQETPPSNRVAWFGVFPEPLAEGVSALTMEATSQFLRPDFETSSDGRTFARLDGEDWMLTGDLAQRTGPVIWNLRVRLADRSGGVMDPFLASWHRTLNTPLGGRDFVPQGRLAYHLERDGKVIGDLDRPGLHLMDTDVSAQFALGDAEVGGRIGASLQLPTGQRDDFSGSGGVDGLVGAAFWKRWGGWRLHGQAERVFIGLPADSPYRAVLGQRAFSRIWAGGGWQGQGDGFWSGLGLDITLAYAGSPYAVGIVRIDRPGWQQHWTLTHAACPRWRFGFSEEAGTYNAPDFTAFVSYRWKD